MKREGNRKIGFFGGSFDPIHFGHLNLAIQILEIHGLDEIWFCPANYSPHKQKDKPVASNEQRQKMVSLAIAPIKQFSLLDVELSRTGPSFTVETLRSLKKQKPYAHFFLLLGDDALKDLSKWMEIDELFTLATPLIGTRTAKKIPALSSELNAFIKKGMTKISNMEISSTELRERLAKKKYCGHLIPEKVLDYINQNKIYL